MLFRATSVALLLLLSQLTSLSSGFVIPRHSSATKAVPTRQDHVAFQKHFNGASTTASSGVVLNALHAKKVEVAMQSNNFARGKLLLFVHKFLVSPTVYYEVFRRILVQTYLPEVALITAMLYAVPLTQWYYLRKMRRLQKGTGSAAAATEETTTEEEAEEAREAETKEILKVFPKTKRYRLALLVHRFGVLQAALYISDVILVFLKLMKFGFVDKYQAQRVAGSIIFSGWLARNVSQLKFYYIKNGISSLSIKNMRKGRRSKMPATNGETELSSSSPKSTNMGVYNRFANRILDVFIYGCAFMNVVDLLGYQIGFALKSIFGLGSFGTLALSLASKDIAAEFVGGLMVQSSNFFDEGETVILQDGTTGVVSKIGWLHTYILKDNDYVVRVPNSQISHQRLARAKRVGRKSRSP